MLEDNRGSLGKTWGGVSMTRLRKTKGIPWKTIFWNSCKLRYRKVKDESLGGMVNKGL